jgi:phospholipid/cholesterol/gamma-HCH transport system substrate-binding protein
LSADTSASILTGGLLGESYIGLQPGGEVESLKAGDEIAFTTPAVDLIQMAGKYIFGGTGGGNAGGQNGDETDAGTTTSTDSPSPREPPTP